MRIELQKLLNCLESVVPGISPREIVEQSSCFIFHEGRVHTYNDEISCSIACDLKFSCAVQALPLLAILRKMTEEYVEVSLVKGELLIVGEQRRAGLHAEEDITLLQHIQAVEKPKKKGWNPLPSFFCDAVEMVCPCAGKDESTFIITCIHITPESIEATDDYQVARYKMDVPVNGSILVRHESIRHIYNLGMTHICETSKWVHFRNDYGLLLSCRQFEGEFPDVSKVLDASTGTPTSFPKGLVEAAEKAAIFSGENSEHNQVLIELRPGKMRIKGEGVSGWFAEVKSIKYKGKPLSFLIDPTLLTKLITNYNEYRISKDILKVEGGQFSYVTCLGNPDDADGMMDDIQDSDEE